MENKKKFLGLRILKWSAISILAAAMLISGALYFMRDKIVNQVVAEINTQLQTPISVADIDLTFWASFPNISVDFNQVYIQEYAPQSEQKDTLFYSDRVRLKFNPFDIIDKNYKVKAIDVAPGLANIKQFEDGMANYEMVKADTSGQSSNFEFSLEKIAFENFDLNYANYKQNQFYNTTLLTTTFSGDFSQDVFNMNVASEVMLQNVQTGEMNLVHDQLAKWDIQLLVDKRTNSVSIQNAPITIAELPFLLNLYSENNLVDVQVAGNNIQLSDFAQRIQHKETGRIKDLEGSGVVEFKFAYFQDSIKNTQASVACSFKVDKGQITEPSNQLSISNIHVEGAYSNQDKDFGEHVRIANVSFATRAGQFEGKALLDQFDNIRIQGSALGTVDLDIIHQMFPIPSVAHLKGTLDLNTDFNIRNRNNSWEIAQCDGVAKFNKAQFQLENDKRFFDHIDGKIILKGDDISMRELSMTIGRSDLAVNGDIRFLNGLFNTKGAIQTNLDLKSAYLNVQDFSSNTKAEEIKDGRNYILPENVDGDIHMVVNNLVYENHSFKRLRSDLNVGLRRLTFNNLHVNNAEADIVGKAEIAENSPEIFTIATEASSNNIRFQNLFKEWDDFEQSVITSDQISGTAQVQLSFIAPFDLRSGIQKNAIRSTVRISVENGRLKNVGSFKEITESLNGSLATRAILKRNNINDFEEQLLDLRFENFQNELLIENGTITIPQMQIVSNAMIVNLSGTHTFDNDIDYRINFNFREIRKLNQSNEFGEIIDDGSGIQLYVRMFGNMDDPTIKWDNEAKRAIAKANFQEEKKTVKSILKSEFGLFSKDESVQKFEAKSAIKEEVKILFDDDEAEEQKQETKKKKKGKFGQTLQKWKEEAASEGKGQFVIGN